MEAQVAVLCVYYRRRQCLIYSRSPIARQDKTALAFPSTRQLKIEMRRTHKNDDAREFIESIV
jgi:hypothetical protein